MTPLVAVAVTLLLLLQAAGHSEPATGPLRVSQRNPRYFCDNAGRIVYLAGSQTGGWEVQDDAWSGYAMPGTHVKLDFDRYLNHLAAHHHNLIRLWTVETTRWDLGPTDMIAAPMQFLRTGPGTALDGRPRFDLTRFDPVYFGRLRTAVSKAQDRGIYVMVMLFEGFGCVHPVGEGYANPRANPWLGHPFNRRNNINGVDADLDGDGMGLEYHSLASPAVVELQKAYVRKVIATVGDLDNVLYEIANESIPASKDWQYEMIRTVRQCESTRPKRHPVVMSAFWPGPTNPALFASPADAVAPAGTQQPGDNYQCDPPAADGRKVVIADADHINWKTKDPSFVWRSFLRGNSVVIFDSLVVPFDWEKGAVCADDGSSEPIRRAVGDVRRYAERINLAEMMPRGDLCSTGYCLAKVGSEYLVYQPGSGEFTVSLAPGRYACEWFSPATSRAVTGEAITARDGKHTFAPPSAGEAVLYLREINRRGRR